MFVKRLKTQRNSKRASEAAELYKIAGVYRVKRRRLGDYGVFFVDVIVDFRLQNRIVDKVQAEKRQNHCDYGVGIFHFTRAQDFRKFHGFTVFPKDEVESASDEREDVNFPEAVFFFFQKIVEGVDLIVLNRKIPKSAK